MKLLYQCPERSEPLIVFLAGCSGAGKTSIATELARRIGVSVVVNTSVIREVQRVYLSSDEHPCLHHSSFDYPASEVLAEYTRQTKLVAEGLDAVVTRLRLRGVPAIVEGVNLLPEFLNLDWPRIFFTIGTPTREELTRHYYERFQESKFRCPPDRYLPFIDRIECIGRHIEARSLDHGTCKIIQPAPMAEMLIAIQRHLEVHLGQA